MKSSKSSAPDTLPEPSKAPFTAFAEGVNIIFGVIGIVGGGLILAEGLAKGVQLTQVVGAVIAGAGFLQMAVVNLVIYLARQSHASRQEAALLLSAAAENKERLQRHGECLDFLVKAADREDRFQGRLSKSIAERDKAWGKA